MSFGFAPEGWALCNGQLLPINQNKALFALLGTTNGGDGQTTFGLPNLQARIPMHAGNGHVFGEAGGEQADTLSVNDTPAHTHAAYGSAVAGDSPIYRATFPAASYDLIVGDGGCSGGCTPTGASSRGWCSTSPGCPRTTAGNRDVPARRTASGGGGRQPIRMHVERFNSPAQRLYDQLGFRWIADKGVYLLLEWNPADA